MKKLTIALVAVISAILLCLGLVACGGSDVAGNTYVFDSYSVSYSSDVDDEDKMSDEELAETKAMYEQGGIEFKFNKDGTCVQTMGGRDMNLYWVQDGKTIYIYESQEEADAGDTSKATELKVDGKKLVSEHTYEGITEKLTFKKK